MSADLLIFTATANVSIASLNMSLMLNKVGFYQVRILPHCLSLWALPDLPCPHLEVACLLCFAKLTAGIRSRQESSGERWHGSLQFADSQALHRPLRVPGREVLARQALLTAVAGLCGNCHRGCRYCVSYSTAHPLNATVPMCKLPVRCAPSSPAPLSLSWLTFAELIYVAPPVRCFCKQAAVIQTAKWS